MVSTRLTYALVIGLVMGATLAEGTIIRVPEDQQTIQEGIDVANFRDTVLVDTGIYYENIDFIGKAILVTSYFILSGDTTIINSTIIDGNASGTVVSFITGEDSTSAVVGFTIRNGYALNGSGVSCTNSFPVIRNNVILNNSTEYAGGGIFMCAGASPIIVENIIRGNNPGYLGWGGGIYICGGCSPYISRNIIIDNGLGKSASSRLSNAITNPHKNGERFIVEGKLYESCRIVSHRSYNGGGILISNSEGIPTSPIIINNTIDGNSASNLGGGIFCYLATPDIRNNIFTSNTGYGIYVQGDTVEIFYNDIWNNTNDYGGSVIEGPGNIHEEPLFVDSVANDFHLQVGSSCIDAGDPGSPLDPDGTVADMGAFYFNQSGVEEETIDPTRMYLKLSVYPNPFTEKTNIGYQVPSIQIYDLSGRLIETTKGNTIGKNLKPGIYFLKAKGYMAVKVVKVR
ncbi:T9SS type A sorting domain-containing protein [candidate division WOR-3 bacterium]|nr:T9SS type A sorting domain-containing protein [candidate division WOR-3 bacterium]